MVSKSLFEDHKELPLANGSVLNIIPLNRDYEKSGDLQKLYDASFPDSERKPYSMILEGLEHGVYDALAFEFNGRVVALSFMIPHKKLVILDYLAVDPKYQNRKIGGQVLNFLEQVYGQPVLVEIESTRNKTADSIENKRKNFYLRNGLNDLGLEICLFGVDMELLSNGNINFKNYRQAFEWYMKPFHRMQEFDLDKKIILL